MLDGKPGWMRWLARVGLALTAGLFAFWLVFTIQWLRFYLPHGGAW